jgi:oxygen-dependent protoporphyrinogen oxidase
MTKKSIAIIGGGISGLSAGIFARQKFGDTINLTIYEKDNRLGGTIGITRENGYIADWGPNGFLDREPLTLEFVKQIGLYDKLYPSNNRSEKRYIYRNGKLWEISANPIKFMKSGLLSFSGRLRIGYEYFVSKKNNNLDETIYNFASRRIGREAAEILIDPMVSGIFGGDAENLSLEACFPIMEKMEQEYGGLIKAMIQKKKENRKSGQKGGPAGPAGRLTSFRGGLYTMIERLEEILHDNIRQNVEVEKITRNEDGRFQIICKADKIEYDYIILAVPSYISGGLLNEVSPDAAGLLMEIPYSNLAVVCQGYKISDIGQSLDGFGFLAPHNQNLEILGSIWTSVIFPEQAPDGYALFRTMLGGAKNNDIIELGNERLAELTHNQLSQILGIKEKPSFEKVIIWRKAIPQYIIGHSERLGRIEANLRQHGNIYLAGNAYTGIGLNDAIKRSSMIVSAILSGWV